MERKKPRGKQWVEFCNAWKQADHAEKLALASKCGATYDTAKHWVSEGDTTPAQLELSPDDSEYKEAVEQVLALHPRVKLDFVSFDIETTNLTADFSILLAACILPYGGKPIIFRGDDYPTWDKDRADDKQICRAITQELGQHAIVITHYGGGFDLPYLKAKMVCYGLPPLPPMFSVDSYTIARANFRVASRRLLALSNYFNLGHKEAVDGRVWLAAGIAGSREAMDKIVAHNVQDCLILQRLMEISFPYIKSIRKL